MTNTAFNRPGDTPGVISPEARSGLEPWSRAELPPPPTPRGLGWLSAVGPGVIVLGLSIGSGEFLLGPAAFVRYGLSLLWVAGVAVFLQTVFNMELMRYTMATGEPAFTGFMRTRPHSTFWAWFYTILYILQFGWPAWAGTAAGAVFFLGAGHPPAPTDRDAVYLIGVGAFLLCVLILLIGRRIERTLELLNWVLITVILGGLLALAILLVSPATWAAGVAGLVGLDVRTGEFSFIPRGADFFLLGALAGYAGAGGMGNMTLSNWARDKGYGMAQVAGYIPAAFAGQEVHLAHAGFTFTPDAAALGRWRGWWRIIRADQWGVFFTGALLGMLLPALLYVTYIPAGSDIRGLGIAAALAESVGAQRALLGVVVAGMAAWILFKTQLDILEGMVRSLTDILWTGSRRVRAWRGGSVRAVYYTVLAVLVLWGCIALRLAPPIFFLQFGANVAGIVLIITPLHLLYVNTRLLPPELRPPLWRRAALVATAVFYGMFVTLWVGSML